MKRDTKEGPSESAMQTAAAEHRHIWTIGHSTHSGEAFLALLRAFQIGLLADVRRFPGSRKFPHFNVDFLSVHLPAEGIAYRPLPELGGRRKPLPDSGNTGWRHEAFRGYADYMETEAFAAALNELKKLAGTQRVAYMCSEAVWWRCHRRLISDKLVSAGWQVWHILALNKAEPHRLASPAVFQNGVLSYPPAQPGLF
jgi:uncharacterized protein (DUF488 family)